MPEHPMSFIDWPLCEFKLKPSFKDRDRVLVRYIGPQVVNSREEFAELRTKYRKRPIKLFLEFHRVAYNISYESSLIKETLQMEHLLTVAKN